MEYFYHQRFLKHYSHDISVFISVIVVISIIIIILFVIYIAGIHPSKAIQIYS